MSTWRGGFKPAFPSQPATVAATTNGHSNSTSNHPPFASFNPAAPATFAIGERGRGRGRGRGAPRGLPSKRGGANLSWRRPESTLDDSVNDRSETAPDAFRSIATVPGGGPSSAFNPPTRSTFQTPPAASAFGASGTAFGGSTTTATSTSVFPETSSTFAQSGPFGSSVFPSAFSSAPAPADSSHGMSGAASEIDHGQDECEEEEEEEEEDGDDDAEIVLEPKRNPAQISTLEVLGEDSDARRKRFESTLANNRYLELKPLREEQRAKAIKQGFIPDPSKPMRLDQATDFEGTCEEMCPEWEREEREYQNNVDPLERYPGTSRIDPSRAVKAFHRPAAGNDQPLPSDVRPPRVLYKTLDYLFHTLLPRHSLAATHPFVRDRTRSVRQDFTVQNVRGHSAIECNERIARYHILALGTLREQTGFSESQELEQLRKVLKSLNEFYDDLRLSNTNVSLPNEAEFRSFHLLTHLRDPDIIWSTELLPPHVFSHPLLQTALELHRLAQRSNVARGERASPNAFSRFFKLVESTRVPYLFGCILSTHFNEIRRNALEALRGAYLKQHSAFPLRVLTNLLGCDDEADTRSVCEQLGIVVKQDERGNLVAELYKGATIKSTPLKLKVSRRLVEAKRGSTSYQAVIDGTSHASKPVPRYPSNPWHPSSSPIPAPTKASAPTETVPRSIPSGGFPPAFSQQKVHGPPISSSVPSSTFPSPVPTPPPPALPTPPPPALPTTAPVAGDEAQAPSLNAAASPFVPANLTIPPQRSPFSFASASSTSIAPPSRSEPAQPAPVKPVPPFSFAPTAEPFIPWTAATPTGPPSQPMPAPPPPRPLPPVTASSPPTVFANPKPLSPDSGVGTRRPSPPSRVRETVVAPLRRISSTLAHASPRLTAHHHHSTGVPTSAAAPPPPPSKIDRTPLIDALARALTLELVLESIRAPVRRIAQDALKETWLALDETRTRETHEVAAGLTRDVVTRIGRLLVREVGFDLVRQERLRREVLDAWRERVDETRTKRRERHERQHEWEQVMKGLEAVRVTTTREPGGGQDFDENSSGDEIFDDEGDEEGGFAAGDGYVDSRIDALSLAVDKPNGRVVGANRLTHEQDLADKLRLAARLRQRIWTRSTFLDILASRVSTVLRRHGGGIRLLSGTRWTTLVSSPRTNSSFATWLSCKFGLDGDDKDDDDDECGRATTVRRSGSTLTVQMLSHGQDPDQEDLESTGLVVFDCTVAPDSPFDWTAARAHLQQLVANIERDSLYTPSLLVVVCPNETLDQDASRVLRESISRNLDLASLSGVVASASVMVIELEGAESTFESTTDSLLASISIRGERVRRPLSAFSKPLLLAWRTSMHANLDRHRRDDIAPVLVSTYVDELQGIVNELENVVHPPLARSFSVPSFPDVKGSFRSALSSYASNGEFASVGHFPELAAAFAQLPPLSDHRLARLMLDLVDQFTTMAGYPPESTVYQSSLEDALRRARERLDDRLVESSLAIDRAVYELDRDGRARAAAASVVEPDERKGKENEPTLTSAAHPSSSSTTKKRKASVTPSDSLNRSPKKASGAAFSSLSTMAGGGDDPLTALERLMKDTKALLAA